MSQRMADSTRLYPNLYPACVLGWGTIKLTCLRWSAAPQAFFRVLDRLSCAGRAAQTGQARICHD
jgi:hypothetical protein